jgi:hypothetical protein
VKGGGGGPGFAVFTQASLFVPLTLQVQYFLRFRSTISNWALYPLKSALIIVVRKWISPNVYVVN